MKLATLKNGTRDGQLVVVSRDLGHAVAATGIAPTLWSALENWDATEPALRRLFDELNAGSAVDAFDLEASNLAAPLPRASQWIDASAFHTHSDLLDKVFNSDPVPDKRTTPMMYQGASDDFLGPRDDIALPSEADHIDFEAEIAVVVDDVPMATRTEHALDHVKLLLLLNDVSLRAFVAREIRTGYGFLQAKPSTAFAPVAVTPDELGNSWSDGRVHLRVDVRWNDDPFGHPHAGAMGFGFHELIAHAARTRRLRAGTIIGSGTISNEDFREVGSSCIAERRGIELLDSGEAATGFMRFGDTVRVDMSGEDGQSIFGSIEQRVVAAPLTG